MKFSAPHRTEGKNINKDAAPRLLFRWTKVKTQEKLNNLRNDGCESVVDGDAAAGKDVAGLVESAENLQKFHQPSIHREPLTKQRCSAPHSLFTDSIQILLFKHTIS